MIKLSDRRNYKAINFNELYFYIRQNLILAIDNKNGQFLSLLSQNEVIWFDKTSRQKPKLNWIFWKGHRLLFSWSLLDEQRKRNFIGGKEKTYHSHLFSNRQKVLFFRRRSIFRFVSLFLQSERFESCWTVEKREPQIQWNRSCIEL